MKLTAEDAEEFAESRRVPQVPLRDPLPPLRLQFVNSREILTLHQAIQILHSTVYAADLH